MIDVTDRSLRCLLFVVVVALSAGCGGHAVTRTVTVTRARAACTSQIATANFDAIVQAKQVVLDDRRMIRAHLAGPLALRINRGILRSLERAYRSCGEGK